MTSPILTPSLRHPAQPLRDRPATRATANANIFEIAVDAMLPIPFIYNRLTAVAAELERLVARHAIERSK